MASNIDNIKLGKMDSLYITRELYKPTADEINKKKNYISNACGGVSIKRNKDGFEAEVATDMLNNIGDASDE